jgi:3'-phosphoadenosine 5'-phosphosulfate sulfotransferase (PAPS reductase)/FAD synthetase
MSSKSISLDDVPTGRDSVHVALVSGGMDSTVAASVAVDTAPKIDMLAYLDTGTGLRENREYIEELASALEAQLWTLRTHEEYEEKVRENGFPGPSRHGMFYNFLKERQIQKLATVTGGQDLVFWTGVRSDESERRMKNVEGVQEGRRWTWVAPIHDWTKDDCREYLDERDLPRNDLWDTLGRSGDCFCGCFGSPEEKLDLRAAGCEYQAKWLDDLESEVETGDETEVWAWGALSSKERRATRAEKTDGQMTLCSTCEPSYPNVRTDGGETDGE